MFICVYIYILLSNYIIYIYSKHIPTIAVECFLEPWSFRRFRPPTRSTFGLVRRRLDVGKAIEFTRAPLIDELNGWYKQTIKFWVVDENALTCFFLKLRLWFKLWLWGGVQYTSRGTCWGVFIPCNSMCISTLSSNWMIMSGTLHYSLRSNPFCSW
jgi:hypothetical protein